MTTMKIDQGTLGTCLRCSHEVIWDGGAWASQQDQATPYYCPRNPARDGHEVLLSTVAPSLPYAGTSGFSGTDASMDRALKNDHTGKTGRVQGMILAFTRSWGPDGVTIKDLRGQFPGEHHGTLSGELTALHQDGRLARLSVQRDRCSVYVTPDRVLDRETLDPATPKKRRMLEVRGQDQANYVGAQVLAALADGVDEVMVRWER